MDIADGLYTEPSAAAEKEADDDLDDAGSDEMGEDSEKDEETAENKETAENEETAENDTEVVESEPMKQLRLRFASKQQPPSNIAAADAVEFPSASGVAQEQLAEPWVVVWHPQEEKALRTKISGSQPPEFSDEVVEPPNEPEDDDFMIAKWADGTESLIPNWTVRDARAKAEVDKTSKKEVYPTYYTAELQGNKIEVKKRVLSQNREKKQSSASLRTGSRKPSSCSTTTLSRKTRRRTSWSAL